MKKYNSVIVSGCSFSHAVDRDEPYRPSYRIEYDHSIDPDGKRTSYAKELAKIFDIPFTNLGKGGAAINGSIYRIYKYFKNNPQSTNNLVVLGLTDIFRIDRVTEKCTTPITQIKNEQALNTATIGNYKDGGFDTQDYLDWVGYWRSTYKHIIKYPMYHQYIASQVNMLQSHCKYLGNDIVVFSALELGENPFVDNLLTFPNNCNTWQGWIASYDSTYQLWHPNASDHKILAKYIYDNLEKLLK